MEIHTGGEGDFTKSAVVQSDDPAQPGVDISIQFSSHPLVKLSNDRLFAPSVVAEEKFRLPPVRLEAANPQRPLLAPAAVSDRPDLKPILTTVKKGLLYELNAEYSGNDAPGSRLNGTITVTTGLTEQPEFKVAYLLVIIGRVRATPGEIQYGFITKSDLAARPEAYARTFQIDYPGGKGRKLAIKKISADSPALTVVPATPPAGDGHYSYTLRLSPEIPAGMLHATLLIQTGDSKMPLLKIPVSATIQP